MEKKKIRELGSIWWENRLFIWLRLVSLRSTERDIINPLKEALQLGPVRFVPVRWNNNKYEWKKKKRDNNEWWWTTKKNGMGVCFLKLRSVSPLGWSTTYTCNILPNILPPVLLWLFPFFPSMAANWWTNTTESYKNGSDNKVVHRQRQHNHFERIVCDRVDLWKALDKRWRTLCRSGWWWDVVMMVVRATSWIGDSVVTIPANDGIAWLGQEKYKTNPTNRIDR